MPFMRPATNRLDLDYFHFSGGVGAAARRPLVLTSSKVFHWHNKNLNQAAATTFGNCAADARLQVVRVAEAASATPAGDLQLAWSSDVAGGVLLLSVVSSKEQQFRPRWIRFQPI
jgi:hypothetical protein